MICRDLGYIQRWLFGISSINSSICEYEEQPFDHKDGLYRFPSSYGTAALVGDVLIVFKGNMEDVKLWLETDVSRQLSSDQNPAVWWHSIISVG